jgi:tetratricopeptide (TPR) repeat protein
MSALAHAAAWKARGHALESAGAPDAAVQAGLCYEQGIALLRELPLEDSRVRHDLGVLWMNRGNALQKLATPTHRAEAVRSYDRAVGLLNELPVAENAAYRNALGAAWMNRGHALRAMGRLVEAIPSFEQAIAILRPLADDADPYFRRNLLAAWANLADAQLADGQPGAASDAVDAGLERARQWKGSAPSPLAPLARRLFQFGAQLYASHQPHFLAEFLAENRDTI